MVAVLQICAIAFFVATAGLDSINGTQQNSAIEYIVVLKYGNTIADLQSILPPEGATIIMSRLVHGTTVARVDFANQNTRKQIEDNPIVEYVTPNRHHSFIKPVNVTMHTRGNYMQSSMIANGQVLVLSKEFANKILKNLTVIRRFGLKDKVMVLVQDLPSKLEHLKNTSGVHFFEENKVMSLPNPVNDKSYNIKPDSGKQNSQSKNKNGSTCYKQHGTGQSIWGIIRTSYRSKPDYNQQPYVYSRTGQDVTMYVVDTGVDVTHPQFQPKGRATFGYVTSELSSEGPYDLNGHGTNVASLAAGETYGIAKNASIVAVKVLNCNGSGSTYGIAEGVSWVVNQVTAQKSQGKTARVVINMSLGGPNSSRVLSSAISEAVSEGIVVVVAAGNDGVDASTSFPAAYDTTITVGAVGPSDGFASFSNYGSVVDISAAGVSCLGAYSTSLPVCAGKPPADCLVYMSGTGQASPHVAGVVALWLDGLTIHGPESTSPSVVKAMLQGSATRGLITFNQSSSNAQKTTFDGILYRGDNCTGKIDDSYADTASEMRYTKSLVGVTLTIIVVSIFCFEP